MTNAEKYSRPSVGTPGAIRAAQRRSMSERLELALSWNKVAYDLRVALRASSNRLHAPSR